MKIPCDTIARLSHVLGDEAPFNCFRLDNGRVIASNRKFMAVESVAPFEGVFYIAANEALIEQCKIEAQYSSVVDFTPVAALKYTTAITSMGFKAAENIGLWPDGPTDFDRWIDIARTCAEPLSVSDGPLVVDVDGLRALAAAAPSGQIVTEQCFSPRLRPTVVRDCDSADWVGFFHARLDDHMVHPSATVPGWCK